MRHAKSSWSNGSLKDYDRPLNNRGMQDAPRIGKYLKGLGLIPDQIIGSPALRAKQTVLKVSEELGVNSQIITWDEDLYFRDLESYIYAIKRADEGSDIVMVTGHYPMVHDVVSSLIGYELDEHFSTATVAALEAKLESWKDLDVGSCKLNWMIGPKQLSDQ